MSHEFSNAYSNPNTFSTSEVVEVDCVAQYPPFDAKSDSPSSNVPSETIRFVLNLAAESLPEDEKSVIRYFLEGKTKQEVAAELGITYDALYYLWRGAYMRTRAFLESHSSIDAEVKHHALVKVSSFLNEKN